MGQTNQNSTGRCHPRTSFLSLAGLLSLIIGVFQLVKYFKANNAIGTPPSAWSLLMILPVLLAFFLIIIAILNQAANPVGHRFLDWLSQKRSSVAIFLLGVSILLILLISRTADLNDPILNHGMEGLGLLFFSLIFLGLVFLIGFQRKNDEHRFFLFTLLIIVVVWVFMVLTRVGLQPDQAYWNVAGVPVMWVSLAGIILMILIIHQLVTRITDKTKWKPNPKIRILLEVLLVLSIWMAAALLWINTPYSNSYFLVGPLAPDGHYWPKSDAQLMDLGGQYLIIGGKLETPYFTEKPYYALFLGLLHFLFGQSYQTISNIQILILALFPVLLYFLGKQLSGKLFGIALAFFAIIKEATAILFTFKISVSNSRLLLTEFPSALLLVLVTILIFNWLYKKDRGLSLPLLAGAMMGVASFVRSNNLVVLFVLLVFLLIWGLKELKIRYAQILVFTLGVAMVILPWTIYNQISYGKDPITWKVQSALETRFDDSSIESRDEAPETLPGIPPAPLPEATELPENTQSGVQKPVSPLHASSAPADENIYTSRASIILGHFLNNQVKALFVLPFQVYPASPTVLLNQEYWNEPVTWSGKMPAEHIAAFAVNLVFIALGLSFAYKKFKIAGLVPLVVQMAYYLSNALVRTSGSRYLLAADWVSYLYFLLGIWVVLRKIKLLPSFSSEQGINREPSPVLFWALLAFCTIIGLSLPVLNTAFPTLYHNEGKAEVYQRLPMDKIEAEVGITPSQMLAFYNKPNTVFLYGREIYPAYLENDLGPVDKGLRFTLLTPDKYEIIIPYGIELTENLPAGEDMIALGCRIDGGDQILTYLSYFVQSDQVIWSTSTTFKDICP